VNLKKSAILFVAAVFIALLFLPSFRYFTEYNFTVLCITGCAIMLITGLQRKNPPVKIMSALTLLSAILNIYGIFHSGVSLAFDGREYWQLAGNFASGNGYGSTYRPPLYPVLSGLFIGAGDKTGIMIVVFQHLIIVGLVPGTYILARLCGFSCLTGYISAAFVSINSLLMQSAGFIMTEIVFCIIVMASIAAIMVWYRRPTAVMSAITGILFACAEYTRQIFLPVFIAGIIIMLVKHKGKAVKVCATAIAVFLMLTAPWSIANSVRYGHYSISSGAGIQLFTKAFTFNCIKTGGKYYGKIRQPLENAMHDIKVDNYGYSTSSPEDDWKANLIPHALSDSLIRYHYMSGFSAGTLLAHASIEGIMAHPARYASSVANSMGSLMLSHREIYPELSAVLPINTDTMPFMIKRLLNNSVYISGWFLILFIPAFFLRKPKDEKMLVPFAVVTGMYFITACVQAGFTRYTIPWEPFKAICAAFCIETILTVLINITRKRILQMHL
jgi:4-amino-4-deoxy-L-arabinose transferase-like glycosyltransferase